MSKSNHFYSEIVEMDSFYLEIDDLSMSEEEKEQIKKLINSSLHHTILDAILSELSEDDKKVFLDHVFSGRNDEVWNHLNQRIEKIEEKIKKTAEDLKEKIREDIKSTKPDSLV